MIPPIEQLTADGYDLQFGTNVIGAYFPPAYLRRAYLTRVIQATGISLSYSCLRSSPRQRNRRTATRAS